MSMPSQQPMSGSSVHPAPTPGPPPPPSGAMSQQNLNQIVSVQCLLVLLPVFFVWRSMHFSYDCGLLLVCTQLYIVVLFVSCGRYAGLFFQLLHVADILIQ